MSTSRIFRNFSFLTAGKVVGDLSTFALFVVLSRVYGDEGIGRYSFAMALTGFFAIFGEFGLYNLSITEMSRRDGPLKRYLGGHLSLRLVLSILSFAALAVVVPFLPVSAEAKTIVLVIGAYQFIYKLFNGLVAVFIAEERMGVASALEIAVRVGIALGGIAIALGGGSLSTTLVVMPLVTVASLGVVYGLVARGHGAPMPVAGLAEMVATARRALPFLASSILFQFSARIDVLFLGLLLGEAAAGTYNVAYRIVFLLTFSYYYAAISMLPAASRFFVKSRAEMEALYRTSLRLITLSAVPASAGLMLIAPDLIDLVFGAEFAGSIAVLRWLSWLLVLAGLKHALGTLLMAGDRQIVRVRSQWSAAGVNVAGNLILIPLLGIRGAVIATLVSESLLVVLLLVRTRAFLGRTALGSPLAISLVASACFFLPFSLLGPFPLFVVLPASVLIYGVVCLAFGEIRRTELDLILRRLGRRGGVR